MLWLREPLAFRGRHQRAHPAIGPGVMDTCKRIPASGSCGSTRRAAHRICGAKGIRMEGEAGRPQTRPKGLDGGGSRYIGL